MISLINRWLKRTKELPPPSKGNELFAYFNLPAPIVGWAMSRRRKEYSVDLESLWEECPRADWLLRVAMASGLSGRMINEGAAKVLGMDKDLCASDSIETVLQAVTKMIESVVAEDGELDELRMAPLQSRTGGGRHGPTDEEFERAAKIDQAIDALHRPYSDEVRQIISYTEVHHSIYEATSPK